MQSEHDVSFQQIPLIISLINNKLYHSNCTLRDRLNLRLFQIPESSTTLVESLGSTDSLSSVISIKTNDDKTPCDSNDTDSKIVVRSEQWWSVAVQVAIPFIIAGFGTIGAGVVLGNVQVRNEVNVYLKNRQLITERW